MRRALLMVLDSVGVGGAADAEQFGDKGADTLGHIAEWCARRAAEGGRGRPLRLPTLAALGLGEVAALSRGRPLPGFARVAAPRAVWGCALEHSPGKDTISGHWEMAGLPVTEDWGYFRGEPAPIPAALLDAIAAGSGVAGFLGNQHASGTEIIQRLGPAHLETGWPIVYTSADSVLQIAAHETAFGLDRLYQLCAVARPLADAFRIGRIIARPFRGTPEQGFQRTPQRRDWATPPPAPTLLDRVAAGGGEVVAIGKVSDIFAGRGVTRTQPAYGLEALVAASSQALAASRGRSLVFSNLVDFDQEFGHRRDVAGYADALERFDSLLPDLCAALQHDDLLLLCADHGNDPTWPGSDHTREQIPVLAFSPSLAPRPIGRRDGFADIGQSLAHWLGLPPLDHGVSFL